MSSMLSRLSTPFGGVWTTERHIEDEALQGNPRSVRAGAVGGVRHLGQLGDRRAVEVLLINDLGSARVNPFLDNRHPTP
jgi:hypothetical protein